MYEKTPRAVVLAFANCINRQDVDGICSLMTEDHMFVDAEDTVVQGREEMRTGWITYFSWVPDYTIRCDEILGKAGLVLVIGRAGGTYQAAQGKTNQAKWDIPAAWKAVVRDHKIAEWRVYADNAPMRRLMDRFPPD
jgi:ketosteroid isomerase-like protein